MHLLSFRSCSEDKNAECNRGFFEQLAHLSNASKRISSIGAQHLFQGLPLELQQDSRWQEHLQASRGRGFWFWKPALVNYLWRKNTFQDGDTVIWADADDVPYVFSDTADDLFKRALSKDKWDVFAKSMRFCENEWTKGDIFKEFNVPWNSEYGLTQQAHAQFFVLRLNNRTRRFMQHWEDLVSNYQLVSDEPSEEPSSPWLTENRHDQSLLSMLVKANKPVFDFAEFDSAPFPCLNELPKPWPLLEPASIRPFKRASEWPWERHPRFGVEGLRVKMGDFERDALENESPVLGQAASALQRQRQQPPSRTICIQGSCSDLDALVPGTVPPGVSTVA